MAAKFNIHAVREIIKPSISTLESKRIVKLSVMDQLNFALSTPIILFFSNKDDNVTTTEKCKRLKSSLSETLTLFPPVAGTIRDNTVIECNDNGIEYVEATIDCNLSQILSSPDMVSLEELMPIDINPENSQYGAKVQVITFICGGLAIGISLSPKIGDATALLTFVLAWAFASSNNSSIENIPEKLIPHFIGDSIISSLNDCMNMPSLPTPQMASSPIQSSPKTTRFLFSQSNITLLQEKGSSEIVPRPSRVEAITALIWKSLIRVSRNRTMSEGARNCVASHAVNLRRRFIPPLPERYIGNLSGRYMAEATENNLTLQELVARLRGGLNETTKLTVEGLRAKDVVQPLLVYTMRYSGLHNSKDVDFYNFRSLCGFPLYETNFGWGEPDWVIVTNPILKNYILMIDTNDGEGMEAWVSLNEEDADELRTDKELLQFAQVNPPVVTSKKLEENIGSK